MMAADLRIAVDQLLVAETVDQVKPVATLGIGLARKGLGGIAGGRIARPAQAGGICRGHLHRIVGTEVVILAERPCPAVGLGALLGFRKSHVGRQPLYGRILSSSGIRGSMISSEPNAWP